MVSSIFKAIRNNDIQLVNYFISLATPGSSSDYHANLSKQQTQWIQQHYLKNSKLFDLNKRSSRGKTALHYAVTWNRIDIAEALIDCQQVNINLRDRENGWTALHRSLYMGNIEIARMLLKRDDVDLTIRDWEGLTAFEIYETTVPDTYPQQHILKTSTSPTNVIKGGTDLYSWGHNTNYVLGHPDSENRSKPERVKMLQLDSTSSTITTPDHLIESVILSKYHMAILTSDAVNNLLVCGFGRGGRLGTGKEIDTQLTPVRVSWPERIVTVALGRDHTVAVTENGNVITFGSNRYGQLGHEMDRQEQLVPRKIQAQGLKKQPIMGAAASSVHSVVYTRTDVFTFGYNQGQLGYHQLDNNELCQITPRKITMATEIEHVVANDNATAILNKSHEIILLCNYTQQRLFLPVYRFPSNINVHRSEVAYPVKLLGSNTDQLGALTNTGDVFLWTCTTPSSSTTTRLNKATTVSAPKRIWTRTKPHLTAVDASLGHHEVIVCTISGHVFIGANQKFSEIPQLQRCIHVSANSSGAFAAVRSEYSIPPMPTLIDATLEHDLVASLPHVDISNYLENELKTLKESMELDLKEIEDDTNAWIVREDYDEKWKIVVHDAWQQIEKVAEADSTLDVVFNVGNKRIYCHRFMLECRSVKDLNTQLAEENNIRVEFDTNKRMVISLANYQMASVLLFLDYVYTDTYQHPMKSFFTLPALCLDKLQSTTPATSMLKMMQKDLVTLADTFDMPPLISSAQSSFSYQPTPSLRQHLEKILNTGDIQLETKEGDILRGHQVVLRQRCPFFKNMLQPGSVWMPNRRVIHLNHIPTEVLELILRYIYLDDLFDDTIAKREKEELMMLFLLTMLCEADALLLDRLKALTERSLMKFIKLRSATKMLTYADVYYAESLKLACLQFITANLSVFLGSSMLDDLSIQLVREVQNYARDCQSQAMPTLIRYDSVEKYDETNRLDEEDVEFSNSLYALSRGNGSVVTFDEVLVTYYPEKPLLKQGAETKRISSPKSANKIPTAKKVSQLKDIMAETDVTAKSLPRRTSSGWLTNDTHLEQSTKPSLREIIETENRPTVSEANGKPQKSSVALKKISQKERKRLAHQQELTMTEPSSSKPVWGKVPIVEVKPIMKIMAETTKTTSNDPKGKKIYIPEEMLDEIHEMNREDEQQQLSIRKISFDPTHVLGSSFQLTPIHRYNTVVSSKELSGHKKSFQTIQKQQELEDNWLKGGQPKKNIIQIQKEEAALRAIEQYYVQTFDIMSGEWCEIQRILNKKN
ncbi:MAG: hypothetical protein EXX96DRAFT_582639 [Benjaminiella poitrasii]|nr:MAG: hypothetical protein EXX96DRAFT_582639 [Benjaminiella poitrasii]